MATAQQHLDQLNALDLAFLLQEGPNSQMHFGGVALFAGPPPRYEDLLDHIRARLDRVPRYRQRLAEPPLRLGRPRWVDDPTFNLEYHVRHNAVASPGDERALRRLVARVFSQHLDRNKPLWEILLVEGLQDDRFALITKTHNAVVDGIAGVDITTALFDLTPKEEPDRVSIPWLARPLPASAELAAVALNGSLRNLASIPVKAAETLTDRAALERTAREAGAAAMSVFRPAPSSPLNAKIGPHRRVAFVDTTLEDFRTVKGVFGGAVNDVVLAVVAGALRQWMHERGLKTEGLDLRAGVPISTRRRDEQQAAGNHITQLVAPLPVDVPDPVARLRIVQEAMAELTASREALGAEVIAGSSDFAPPTILAQSGRWSFSSRAYNVRVTNVPGPQVPMYLLGRELQEAYPLSFLAGDRALAVAAMSYRGVVGFGLIADADSIEDLETIAQGVRDQLAEYVALARRRAARGRTSRRMPKKTAGT